MEVYMVSNARQNFARLLDEAKQSGKVLIRRRDGSLFSLVPEKKKNSLLDVKGLNSKMSRAELLDILRESKELYEVDPNLGQVAVIV